MPCGDLVTFGDDISASKQSLTGACLAARKPPPVDRRSGANRTCERVQEIGLGDDLETLTPNPSPACAGEGRPEPRARAFQCGRSCVSSYILSAPEATPERGDEQPAPGRPAAAEGASSVLFALELTGEREVSWSNPIERPAQLYTRTSALPALCEAIASYQIWCYMKSRHALAASLWCRAHATHRGAQEPVCPPRALGARASGAPTP